MLTTRNKENKMQKELRAYYDPKIQLTETYLYNAIDEIQAMYAESVDIPDWLVENIQAEGGFKYLAKAIQLQQVSILDYDDAGGIPNGSSVSCRTHFDYFVHDEMIDAYLNKNKEQGEQNA